MYAVLVSIFGILTSLYAHLKLFNDDFDSYSVPLESHCCSDVIRLDEDSSSSISSVQTVLVSEVIVVSWSFMFLRRVNGVQPAENTVLVFLLKENSSYFQ